MGNILVTGAGGQLGNELRLLTKGRKRFIFTDAVPCDGAQVLDICDPRAVEAFFEANGISAVINCAAYTNVDGAESDVARCRAVNVDGVRNLALAAKRRDAVLIHVSTDYVFDGKRRRGAYREDSPCHPESVYGSTKREGELAIRRSRVRGIIIRTAWLYSPFGKNFVK
ncbi:MAG: sugar nucleotide-binding protein, partial [Bacteroidales bacterium]|nr:sugar nucleotide-binding protein [Bacteroidales bacterium]